jgi:hypothetical protein
MSRRTWLQRVVFVCFCAGMIQSITSFAQQKELTPKELIDRHLQSIGKTEDIAKVKSRGISGKAQVEFIQGAKGRLSDGQFPCVSEGQNIGIKIAFKDNSYAGEYFAYNGKETTVGHITPGQKSPAGDFVFRHNALMREGLLGGVLSTAWPLLRPTEELPEMTYKQEKLGENSYHVLEYGPRKLGDLKIRLFFDPQTFRHVRTEYQVRLKNDMSALPSAVAGMGPGPVNQGAARSRPDDRAATSTILQSQAESIYLLVEKFGNFVNFNGLALPQDYGIEYSLQGSAATFIAKWTILLEHWMNNAPKIDQNFFVAQK